MNRWKKEQKNFNKYKVCVKDPSKRCGQSRKCVLLSSSCPRPVNCDLTD